MYYKLGKMQWLQMVSTIEADKAVILSVLLE